MSGRLMADGSLFSLGGGSEAGDAWRGGLVDQSGVEGSQQMDGRSGAERKESEASEDRPWKSRLLW